MRFSSEQAQKRYIECRQFAYDNNLIDNFNAIFAHLLSWERFDDEGQMNEIFIGCDFEEKCFTFHELYASGRPGVCGGIIFHGTPKCYLENGSVQLTPSCGWQIHT